uniref:Chitin-binding type-2 domain-containing protein n=1 Tax=Angiostrongylus cantonensis TaxID=6313 RepID=A0A0K0DHZ0_ANGCA
MIRLRKCPEIKQDLDARESDVCAVSATCLQADSEIPSSYLQCDQTSLRWVRRSCQDGFVFNFEQQTCVVPKRMSSLSLTSDVSNAECTDSLDCPPTFICINKRCHLRVCPRGNKVFFTCTNIYQCKAGEFCLLGGCCPKKQMKSHEKVDKPSHRNIKYLDTVTNPAAEHRSTYSTFGVALSEAADQVTDADLAQNDGVLQLFPTPSTNAACTLDRRVDECSMSNPCPEADECINGQCCQIMGHHRCQNGLWPLSIPHRCSRSQHCPIQSRCERSTCCPFDKNFSDTSATTVKPLFSDLPSSKTKSRSESKSIDSNSTAEKFRCLVKHRCSASRSLCPPEFTCTLDGRCCYLNIVCPDGSVPEAMCSEDSLCPSTTHMCVLINEKSRFCCNTKHRSSSFTFSCPTGSFEVNPRFGTICRYSLQCPSPYFCNSMGKHDFQAAPACSGGGIPIGQCNLGYCSPGYSCQQNLCCPSYAPPPSPRIQAFVCPSGSPSVGNCVNGACATGFSCVQNQCCPSLVTKNPFVCPNGNQAAGGCVNGQCGAGYTCQNGLCCAGTTAGVRCLDGSEAVGACIPSCQGDGCGGVQITYYCGSGYTCTTGNICCPVTTCPQGGDPIGPPVNGLCPQGSTLQGGICCSNVGRCPDGSAGTPPVNGICPAGTTLTGNVCCPVAGALVGVCDAPSMGIGPCTPAGCSVGYACDNNPTNPQCCPVVNFRDPQFQIGPAVAGMCPVGYVAVYPPSSANPDGTNDGVCVDLQTVPGLCALAVQAGPCSNGQCQPGFTCNTYADICCPTTTAFSRLKSGHNIRPTAYGRPLHSYMPHVLASAHFEMCNDGSAASGGCINGLCGVGLECQNGLCCPPPRKETGIKSICPNNEVAVSGCFPNGVCGSTFECVKRLNLCCPPGGNDVQSKATVLQETIRPIGARCVGDTECVGYQDGLSLCHAGVCQCSPIAYSQGIACVRLKHFKVNDSPVGDDEK